MMKILEILLTDWQRMTCNHRWLRARWQDGSYGLRCSQCMKRYHNTWNDIIAGPNEAKATGSGAQVMTMPVSLPQRPAPERVATRAA
jgi:hypothetical protein